MSDIAEDQKDQNQEQGGGDKIQKQHVDILTKLAAIVGGEQKLTPARRLAKGGLPNIVADLFKEENEAKTEDVKAKLKDLLKGYVEFNKLVKAEEAKLAKFKQGKMKEFNDSANAFFALIEDNGADKEYIEALAAAIGTAPEKKAKK